MSYKKFTNNDIFFNVIKAKPRFEFKIQGGNIYLNNSDGYIYLKDLLITPPVLETATGCLISLDFSCVDNTQYIPVI
jgi:hypothetical protein